MQVAVRCFRLQPMSTHDDTTTTTDTNRRRVIGRHEIVIDGTSYHSAPIFNDSLRSEIESKAQQMLATYREIDGNDDAAIRYCVYTGTELVNDVSLDDVFGSTTTDTTAPFTDDELADIARRIAGHNDTVDIERNGYRYQFQLEDDDRSVMEMVSDCDGLGKLAWPHHNRETGRDERPRDFDGSARKFTSTPMHDEIWWMPYRDENGKVYDSPEDVRFMERLLDWGYVGISVTLYETCECCDTDNEIDRASLWGIESPLCHDDDAVIVDYFADVIADLVVDVTPDAPNDDRPDNLVRDDDYRDHAGDWHCGWCGRVGNPDPRQCGWCGDTDTLPTIPTTATCVHCERTIHEMPDGTWVDLEATGDDSVWRETCDAHNTFTAEHEPSTTDGTTTTTITTPPTTNGHDVGTEWGCFIGGHHGQYAADRLADVAESFGWESKWWDDDPRAIRSIIEHMEATGSDGGELWEMHSETLDKLTDWLNDHTSDGYIWEWSDGELFFAPICDLTVEECDDENCAHRLMW